MCYKVNDLSKLPDYGFINTFKDTYSLKLDHQEDKKLGNEYRLSIVVNPGYNDNEPNTLTFNYFADVQTIDGYEESAGCDNIVDAGKVFDLINKMIQDGVVTRIDDEAELKADNESYDEICEEDYEPDDYDMPDDNGDYYYDMMKDDGYHLDGHGYWTFD